MEKLLQKYMEIELGYTPYIDYWKVDGGTCTVRFAMSEDDLYLDAETCTVNIWYVLEFVYTNLIK